MPEIEAVTAQDVKFMAEARRQDAEAAKADQERLRAVAETELAQAAASQAKLTLSRDEYRRKLELAGDEHNLFYPFNGVIGQEAVNHCIDVLTTWSRVRPGEDIEIQFNSPGGSLVPGFALWDHIQTIKNQGHKITTSTIGVAASMAGILLQAGDERIIGAESYLMIHETSFGTAGKMGDIEDTVAWVKMVQSRIVRIFASRSNMDEDEIRDRWQRRDWWMDSDAALEAGFVDSIRS